MIARDAEHFHTAAPLTNTHSQSVWCGEWRLTQTAMPEKSSARFTDELAEWLANESDAETSTVLDKLGPNELLFLAGALIVKSEERPKNDQQLGRYLRASKRLPDRAIAGGLGRG